MLAAVGWGTLAASSLLLGALLAFARPWPSRQVGLVLAFGAGALISAVSFELAGEGIAVGSLRSTAIGLGAGALTYFALDGLIAQAHLLRPRSRRAPAKPPTPARRSRSAPSSTAFRSSWCSASGSPRASGIGVGLLVAIFVSNLPEAIGSASEMEASGTPRAKILRLWAAVAAICALATVVGYALADATSGELSAAIDGFAAGALLVMLIDSMIPDATKDAGRVAGLVTTLGFAVATALSSVS